jgi:AP-1 complex subunit gamma-1
MQPSSDEHQTPSPDEVIDLIVKVAQLVTSNHITREYALNALLKLSTRFPTGSLGVLRDAIRSFVSTGNVELQQRAVEYDVLFDLDPAMRAQLLAKMPAAEVKIQMPATLSGERLTSSNGAPRNEGPSSSPDLQSLQISAPPATTSLLGDLLGTSTPSQQSSAPVSSIANDLMGILGPQPGAAPVAVPPGGPVDIMSLFGNPGVPSGLPYGAVPMPMGDSSGLAASFGAVGFGAPPPSGANSGIPPMVAFQNSELTVSFSFKKPNPQQPQFSLISATAQNTSSTPITDFSFLAAPPRHVKFILDAPSTSVIPPGGVSLVLIKAANSSIGEKAMSMKMRISYAVNGQKREIEEVTKTPFPSGV